MHIVFFGSANDDLVFELTCVHNLELDLLAFRHSDLVCLKCHATVRFNHRDFDLAGRLRWIAWFAVIRFHGAMVMTRMATTFATRVMSI